MFCFKCDGASFHERHGWRVRVRVRESWDPSLSVPPVLLVLPLLGSKSWCCHRIGSSLTSSHLLFYLDMTTKSSDLWHLLAGTTKTQRDAQCPTPPGLINQSSSPHRWHWHLCDCWPKQQHEQREILTWTLNQPVWRIESYHPTIWGEFSPFSEPRVNGPLTSWRQNSNKNN